MQFFELLCMFLGIANGALLPLLPNATAKARPIGAVLGFSLAFALLSGFLPVIVSSPRFLTTLIITLVGAFIGFFAVSAAMKEAGNKQPVTRPATQIGHTA
jgi:hypothetical protein